MNPTALTTDSRIVTEIQNRLGQRLAEIPPAPLVRHGVEIPRTFSKVY